LSETLKIVIPMAGLGSRMRPQTWSKPKPLVSVAGKTGLEHLLDTFDSLPDPKHTEYVFIIGYLGDQIPPFMEANYPHLRVHYVTQPEMKGQSHALWLAREHLHGPMVMIYSDTLIETDFRFLAAEQKDGIAWVKPVPDPRRFGVAEVNSDGRITRLVEKPTSLDNNLVLVGCYYFKEGEALISAIEEQMRRNIQLKGEYFLADAVNVMLERGANFGTQEVKVWLDTGTIEATLETNRYFLEHGRENQAAHLGNDVEITRPVFIHPTAQVENSKIGPYVSIGAECRILDSKIENSILEAGAYIESANLTKSFIGRKAEVRGRGPAESACSLNIGDNSSVLL